MRQAGPAATALCILSAIACKAAESLPPSPPVPHLGACGQAANGFLLPGSEACLTIGGFVRAEGGVALASPVPALAPLRDGPAQGFATRDSLTTTTFGTSARLSADVRMPTEFGPVRVYVSLRGRNGRTGDHPFR